MHSKKYFLLVSAFCGLSLSAESAIENEFKQFSTELDEAELEQECTSEAPEKPAFVAEVETPRAEEIGSHAEDEGSNTLLKCLITGLSLVLIAKASYNPATKYISSYLTYKEKTNIEECKYFVLSLIHQGNLIYEQEEDAPNADHLKISFNNCVERYSASGYTYKTDVHSATPEQAVTNIHQYISCNFNKLSSGPVYTGYLRARPAGEGSHNPYKQLTSEMGARFYSQTTMYDSTIYYVNEYVHLVVSDYKKQQWKEHQARCSWSNLFKNKAYYEARWRY